MSYWKRMAKVRRAAVESLEQRTMMTAAPTSLGAASTLNSGGVVLSWQDSAGDNEGYKIERSDDGGTTFTQIAQVADPLVTTYTDFATARGDGHGYDYLDPGTTYTYRVKAYNGASVSSASNTDDAQPNDFALYNNLIFNGTGSKPSDAVFEGEGLRLIDTTGTGFYDNSNTLENTTEAESNAQTLAQNAANNGCKVLVLDIERSDYPFDIRSSSETAVQHTIDSLAPVLGAIHDEWVAMGRTDMRVGIYAGLPQRDYWTPNQYDYYVVQGHATVNSPTYDQWVQKYQDWQDANDFVSPLVQNQTDPEQTVDVLFPSLYTFYTDQPGWETYAKYNMNEAERAFEPDGGVSHPSWWVDKPIVPFLMMDYTNGVMPVEQDYWQRELSVIRGQADTSGSHVNGIVEWGGWLENWDDSAPWWQATKAFATDAVIQSPGYSLVGTATSGTDVSLTWRSVPGTTGYVIQRSTDGATWSTLSGYTITTASNQCSTTVAGTDNELNLYRVQATNNSGANQSRWSNVEATLAATSGTDTSDTLTMDYDGTGGTLTLSLNGSVMQDEIDLSQFGQVRISMFGGDDTLEIDRTNGDPVPSGGVFFSGGAGDDDVSVTGSTGADAVKSIQPSSMSAMLVQPTSATTVARSVWYDAADHASYSSNGGADNVKLYSGTLFLPGDTGLGNLTVSGGNLKIEDSTTAASLSISGGLVQLTAGGGIALRTNSLSITGSGQLDLADNDFMLDYASGSPADTIRGYLLMGYDGGLWDGTGGIISSTASSTVGIGWFENSFLGLSTFDGQSVDSTCLILTPTKYGDANGDNSVDMTDYNTVNNNFGKTDAAWSDGDFNYDGVIDLSDLNAVLNNFGS